MGEKKSKRFPLILALFFIVLGGGGAFLLMFTMTQTSSTAYCISCHEMEPYKAELEKSSHAVDKDKQPLQCAQCHIPPGHGLKFWAAKTTLGLKDMIVHYAGDPSNLNRRDMQGVARRFLVDENCLACHQDLYKNIKDQPISEIGRLCHDAYLGKNGTTRQNCAGCHFNLAHLPEFDRRYFFNAKFAERLPLEKEKK